PLYHPLRLIEEICMLDNLSDGRFMLGMGRGISPIEAGFYGVPGSEMQARYFEASDLILKALQSETLTYQGKYYSFNNVPMNLRPIQKPHPELWYATRTPESFEWAAKAGANTVTLAFDQQVRDMTSRYKKAWVEAGHDIKDLPLVGVSRHIVVAETDKDAKALASRAYKRWLSSFRKLWLDRDGAPLRARGGGALRRQLSRVLVRVRRLGDRRCDPIGRAVQRACDAVLRLTSGDLRRLAWRSRRR